MSDRIEELENKLDLIIEILTTRQKPIDALGSILIRRKTVNERTGINKNTLAKNKNIEKFEELGARRTYIEVGEIPVVRQIKRTKKSRG